MAFTKKVAKHDRIEIDGTDYSNAFRISGSHPNTRPRTSLGFSVSGNDETLPGSTAQGFTGEMFYTEESAPAIWALHSARTIVEVLFQPNGLVDAGGDDVLRRLHDQSIRAGGHSRSSLRHAVLGDAGDGGRDSVGRGDVGRGRRSGRVGIRGRRRAAGNPDSRYDHARRGDASSTSTRTSSFPISSRLIRTGRRSKARLILSLQATKIRNPDFKRALVHIAYKRAHPEVENDEINVKVGTAGRSNSTSRSSGGSSDRTLRRAPRTSATKRTRPQRSRGVGILGNVPRRRRGLRTKTSRVLGFPNRTRPPRNHSRSHRGANA